MGEMADYITEQWGDGDPDDDGGAWDGEDPGACGTDGGNPFEQDDAVTVISQLSDDELRRLSSDAKHPKIVGIREWPRPLSPKQRWCLVFWVAKGSIR